MRTIKTANSTQYDAFSILLDHGHSGGVMRFECVVVDATGGSMRPAIVLLPQACGRLL
ncbi:MULTISPECIES: hypothetical protein [Paraburkholderia]|uniref:hypothetical protein n=1 Tax=Paraburkholderia TaxID=1822464 RepID=UPI0015957B87|nr:hypothetical protein [Paraburkholderia youngii]